LVSEGSSLKVICEHSEPSQLHFVVYCITIDVVYGLLLLLPMIQQLYLKVSFVWETPKPLIEVPRQLTFEPVNAMHDNLLISIRWSSP
jgi:hypothetical protein